MGALLLQTPEGQRFALGTGVSDALRANPSVQQAQAALRQARAQRDVAAAGLWPTLGGSVSAQRSRTGSACAAITASMRATSAAEMAPSFWESRAAAANPIATASPCRYVP